MDIPDGRPSPDEVVDMSNRKEIDLPEGTMLEVDGVLHRLESATVVIEREKLWAAGDTSEPTAVQQMVTIEAETEDPTA